MPVAISENGVHHQQAHERLDIAHRIRRALVKHIPHLLRITHAPLLVLALRQKAEHLAKILLMKPLNPLHSATSPPIIFGKHHAIEALNDEERLTPDGVEVALGHRKSRGLGQTQAVVLVLAQLPEPPIHRLHDVRRGSSSLG